ncbi:hypothetical protein MAR_009020 [Mya arenaria]|uniref:Uncharacterized protein n=1 Tax=Mya arenaria TaxID=6604 RepID=A0ABY7E0D5_MYAAR|nr:hypothetical protein MAR_009020 [Mya arenaria]
MLPDTRVKGVTSALIIWLLVALLYDATEADLGVACATNAECGSGVCDLTRTSSICALVSGGTCDAAKSQCMTYSECTTEGCTCSNGDADETTKLCPSPSSGFREIWSMFAVVTCLFLNQL